MSAYLKLRDVVYTLSVFLLLLSPLLFDHMAEFGWGFIVYAFVTLPIALMTLGLVIADLFMLTRTQVRQENPTFHWFTLGALGLVIAHALVLVFYSGL